jgi:transposase
LQAESTKRSALAKASARIAELERLVGRQQMDIDFFRKALRALERPAAQGKPVSASSKSSKP